MRFVCDRRCSFPATARPRATSAPDMEVPFGENAAKRSAVVERTLVREVSAYSTDQPECASVAALRDQPGLCDQPGQERLELKMAVDEMPRCLRKACNLPVLPRCPTASCHPTSFQFSPRPGEIRPHVSAVIVQPTYPLPSGLLPYSGRGSLPLSPPDETAMARPENFDKTFPLPILL